MIKEILEYLRTVPSLADEFGDRIAETDQDLASPPYPKLGISIGLPLDVGEGIEVDISAAITAVGSEESTNEIRQLAELVIRELESALIPVEGRSISTIALLSTDLDVIEDGPALLLEMEFAGRLWEN